MWQITEKLVFVTNSLTYSINNLERYQPNLKHQLWKKKNPTTNFPQNDDPPLEKVVTKKADISSKLLAYLWLAALGFIWHIWSRSLQHFPQTFRCQISVLAPLFASFHRSDSKVLKSQLRAARMTGQSADWLAHFLQASAQDVMKLASLAADSLWKRGEKKKTKRRPRGCV